MVILRYVLGVMFFVSQGAEEVTISEPILETPCEYCPRRVSPITQGGNSWQNSAGKERHAELTTHNILLSDHGVCIPYVNLHHDVYF